MLLLLLLLTLNKLSLVDIVFYVDDKESVNLHGHVYVTKDAAVELQKGMNAIGSQIGLGATLLGVSKYRRS